MSGMVTGLRAVLGARLVAYLGGAAATGVVNEWAAGEREPAADIARRLQDAAAVVAVLTEHISPKEIQALFQGMNPQLDDTAPARALLEGAKADTVAVLAAARDYTAQGQVPGATPTHTEQEHE